MIADLYDELGKPQRLNCRRTVHRDQFNNPFCVVLEHSPGRYWVKSLADEDFHETLKLMGISDTVIVDHIGEKGAGQIILPGQQG